MTELEKAANEFAGVNYDCEDEGDSFYHMIQKEAFIDGANWMKEQLTQSEVTKTSEQVWSEEDDEIFGRIYYACVMFYDDEDTTLVNWLNAIKRKLKGE